MPSVAENNKRIAKNTIFLYIRLLFSMAVSLYTSRVVLATLGADDFGLNAVVTSVITIFFFLNYSMAGATSRFLTFEFGKKDLEKLKKTFSAALIIHIIIAFAILVIGETIGLWYLENKMIIPESRMTAARWIYQISLVSSMLTITQVPYNASIMAHEKMNAYAYIEIFKTSLNLGIVYLLVIGNFDKLIFYAILTLCVTIAITVIYRIYCIKQFEECRCKFQCDKQILYPMLSFSGWDLFGNFGTVTKQNGINLVLNLFFAAAVNAAYSISRQVSNVIHTFSYNLIVGATPQIVKYYAENNIKQMQNLVFNTSKFSFLLVFAICLPVMLEVNNILNLWLKQVPAYTDLFVRFFLIIQLFECLSNNLFRPIHATGKIKSMTWKISIVDTLVPVLSYLLFKFSHVPVYIPLILILISTVIVVVIKFWEIHKLIPQFSIIDFMKKVVLVIIEVVVPACIVPLFMFITIEDGFLRLVLVTLFSLFSMAFFTYWIALSRQTRVHLVSTVLKKLKLKRI